MIRSQHFFSVVIPLYNGGTHVAKALESVLQQTYQRFEVVVVDDGSTDNGVDIVKKYAGDDARISILSQENAGASAARNRGIEVSRGTHVTFLDADDIWYPTMLETHARLLTAHSGIAWSATAYARRNADGHVVRVAMAAEASGCTNASVIRDILTAIHLMPIHTDTVCIQRAVFDEVGVMDTSLRTAEDLDLWFRIAVKHPRLAYSAMVQAEYRYTDGSLTQCPRDDDPIERNPIACFIDKHARQNDPRVAFALRQLGRRLLDSTIRGLMVRHHTTKARQLLSRYRHFFTALEILGYNVASVIVRCGGAKAILTCHALRRKWARTCAFRQLRSELP